MSDRLVGRGPAAIFALCLAGLGWGTTGLFVRALGTHGLSIYELLIVRLCVTGVIILPLLVLSLARNRPDREQKILRRPTLGIGLAMVFYYLGAITAFHNLQLVIAALIIGSSPIIAWCVPLILEKRKPTAAEWKTGTGVAIAVFGLLLLSFDRSHSSRVVSTEDVALGLLGAVMASLITVFNARALKRLGPIAPKPLDVTFVTVVFGLLLSPLFLSDVVPDFQRIIDIGGDQIWLCLGFGAFATAIPGLAITFAAARLEPQATATVSIQLQVWSGALAWLILGEAMSVLQIVAAVLIIAGSWVTLSRPLSRGSL